MLKPSVSQRNQKEPDSSISEDTIQVEGGRTANIQSGTASADRSVIIRRTTEEAKQGHSGHSR